MATVQSKIQVQAKDVNNLPASITLDVATTSGLLADLQAYAAGYIPLLDAVIGTQILDANLVIPLDLPGGLKGAPVSGTNQMIGALARWQAASTGEFQTVEFFGANNAIFQASPNATKVNLTAGQPFPLLYAYLTSASNATQGVTPDGGLITSLIYAVKNDRKNRRGLERRHRK
jgi:hypothetical protein